MLHKKNHYAPIPPLNVNDEIDNTEYINLTILGSGGHAKTILEILTTSGNYIAYHDNLKYAKNIYVLDDNKKRFGENIYGHIISGPIDMNIVFWNNNSKHMICAIGDNNQRRIIVDRINNFYSIQPIKIKWISFIGYNTTVASTAKIGDGTVILNGCNVGPDVVIGKHCIINNGANVDHDCKIGNYVHIAPNATLCGNVEIGDGTLVGAGAVIIPGIKIGSNYLIKAKSLVKYNITNNYQYDLYINYNKYEVP